MNPIAKFLLKKHDEAAPDFEKGGKLEKLYPIFEAQDTFLFTPKDVTSGQTHIRDAIDLKRLMITVVLALLPCTIYAFWNTGHQYNLVNGLESNITLDLLWGVRWVLPIILTSYIVGGVCEVIFCIVRKHEINEGFLVTGLLFPLTLPPTIPLWQVAVGIAFGTIVGKEIFGGTGFNILNPALTARAFLFFAYPAQISGEVWTVVKDKANVLEGWTAATPLGIAATAPDGGKEVIKGALNDAGYTFQSMFHGLEGGSLAETAAVPILIGAAILIFSGIGSWRIMLSGCIGLAVMGIVMERLAPDSVISFANIPWHYHFVMGSFLFGIVFMATDPVSAAATNGGKWIYGFLIGVLVVLIRVTNPAYPEGVMLAILFMNVMAPLIDHYMVQFHINQRTKYIQEFNHA